jgi:hypothetical protein
VVIISIYVSMFTAIINLLVDFLFVDILFAPTKQSKEKTQLAAPEPTTESSLDPSTKLKAKRLTLKTMQSSKLDLDLETIRVLPSSTCNAHALAKLSVKEIMGDQVSAIKQTVLRHEDQRRAMTLKIKSRAKLNLQTVTLPRFGMDLEEQFAVLSGDIAEQRKLLKRNQQEKFDEMWGIDPTGEFSKQRQTYWYFWSRPKSAAVIIQKELLFVHEESMKKKNKLQHASDVQTGMEILHDFILDLLGRLSLLFLVPH